MRKLILVSALSFCVLICNSQIQSSKIDGGTVVLKLGYGVILNEGSSLKRDWVMLNDAKCPVQLNNVGISAVYGDSKYSFKPVGDISVSEPITAYEIHHVLYNVFGEHIKTLSNQEVIDISDKSSFGKYSSWYASENEVSEYLFVVSYVANVRTKSGTIWRYKANVIKEELEKIKITYEADYAPSENQK